MRSGDCFQCNKPGHWAYQCPLKTSITTKTPASPLPVDVASPPVIQCRCAGGACDVLTSRTEKNPNRRFYKCPSDPSCGFFKWCDQVNIKSQPISVYPTCPCGAGPCRIVTVIEGPNSHRSYFVCCIKKGFGACGFFQWEHNAQITPEPEEPKHIGSPCSTFIGFSDLDSVNDENLLPESDSNSDINLKSNSFGNVVSSDCTLSISAEKDNGDKVVCSGLNNLQLVSNGIFVSTYSRNEEHKEAVRLETEEQVFLSLATRHLEHQVCSDDHKTNGALLEFKGKESYTLEEVEAISVLDATGFSQNANDPVSNGANKPELIHQSSTLGETRASFSGNLSLMKLIEQYNSEKLHFESVSIKHVDALTAFTGSYKQLESLRGRAHSLKKQILEVERQVKCCEFETSEFAKKLQEVSDEMVKSQKKVLETAGKLVKEVRIYRQMDFAAT